MFRQNSSRGTASAKRLVTSLLENTGLVCGSIKDTLAEKDVDMEWIGKELKNMKSSIGSSTKNMADTMTHNGLNACRMGNAEDVPLSPEIVGRKMFFDENSLGENSALSRSSSAGDGGDDYITPPSALVTNESGSSPKRRSQFSNVREKQNRETISHREEKKSSTGVDTSKSITLVIGLCLSRKDSVLGHPDTVTRQTSFNFNELQDRDYQYVSSTDASGWLAGGGEKGRRHDECVVSNSQRELCTGKFDSNLGSKSHDSEADSTTKTTNQKIAAPDKVYIPIIQINAESDEVVEKVVSALARGEIFIPHVSILPEALSVNGSSPPDLVVRFDCEKNDDVNPEDWQNWCLEFLHNQLYDYFAPIGAQWTKRPFQITLARKVKWKTVKHMNKFFAHSEHVVNIWREKGPQFLQPPDSATSQGATREEIARPHGIYLLRNGVPTNYFAPNFQPPYTTKMTRSLIRNVINKSWDSKHRDWLSVPIPRIGGPVRFIRTVMGCTEPDAGALSPVENSAEYNVMEEVESFDNMVQDQHKTLTLSPGRLRRKDVIDSNAPDFLLKTEYSPKIKTQNVAQNAAMHPSDESTKPTSSASSEDTPTHSFIAVQSHSSVESTVESSRQQSKEENTEQTSPTVSPKTNSPTKSVSVNMPIAQDRGFSAREYDEELWYAQQHRRNPHDKIVDSKAEKFAKTKSKRREMRDRRQDSSTPNSKSSPRRPEAGWQNQNPVPSPSCDTLSLAYSMEDSTAFFRGPVSTPTRFGSNDGGSVFTSGTENQSLLSYVTRSTTVQSRLEAEVDDISLSLLESKSSIVPTDDELMAVGWAKALDPTSGSYYYFTLDRSRTVWENPLALSP